MRYEDKARNAADFYTNFAGAKIQMCIRDRAFGGTGRLDIRRTRPQKQEQKHKKSNSMQGNIISLIGSSCGCSQKEAREYLDSEIRYLRELQEADDLREDDMETACLNLGLDLPIRLYIVHSRPKKQGSH